MVPVLTEAELFHLKEDDGDGAFKRLMGYDATKWSPRVTLSSAAVPGGLA
jgi:hypothetical protein